MGSITLQHILSGQPQPKFVELQSMNFTELLTKFGLDTAHPEKYKLVRRLIDNQIGVLDITEQSNPNKMENKFFTDKYTNQVILGPTYSETYMVFEDPEVKRICVENFGGVSGITNSKIGTVGIPGKAGEVSYEQILAVKNLKFLFYDNKLIKKFNELVYFVNLETLNQKEFENCSFMEEITLPNILITSALTFINCKALKKLSTPYGLRLTTAAYFVQNCNSLETLDASNWDFSNCDNFLNMFNGCSKLKNIDVSNWNMSSAINLQSMFLNCSSLETLNTSNWNISSVQILSYMFSGCSKLKNIDVSNWNVSNVTEFQSMFQNCSSLETLDVSNWNMSSAQNISSLFYNCNNILELNVKNWYVSNVTTLANLFYNCTNIKELDLNSWDVSNVVSIQNLFYNCLNLETLKVSNWNTNKISTNITVFAQVNKLRVLDLTNWNMKLTSSTNFIINCSSLIRIIGGTFDISLLPNDNSIFYGCTNLQEFTCRFTNCNCNMFIYGKFLLNYRNLDNIVCKTPPDAPKIVKIQIPSANIPTSYKNQWENARPGWSLEFF